MDFKKGKRFSRKEDLLSASGYGEMEKLLFSMMRDEIRS
jgi:hypothetical protein